MLIIWELPFALRTAWREITPYTQYWSHPEIPSKSWCEIKIAKIFYYSA